MIANACCIISLKTEKINPQNGRQIHISMVVHNFSSSWQKFLSSQKVIVKHQRRSLLGGVWRHAPIGNFYILKGYSHAILVHFKNKKYVLTFMNAQKLLSKTILLHWSYFLSPVASDGTDGNGLQFEKIRLNFSNFFSVLTLNRY